MRTSPHLSNATNKHSQPLPATGHILDTNMTPSLMIRRAADDSHPIYSTAWRQPVHTVRSNLRAAASLQAAAMMQLQQHRTADSICPSHGPAVLARKMERISRRRQHTRRHMAFTWPTPSALKLKIPPAGGVQHTCPHMSTPQGSSTRRIASGACTQLKNSP